MKKAFLFILIFALGFATSYVYLSLSPSSIENPTLINQIKPRPLDKYTIDNLSTVNIPESKFEIEETIKEEADFFSYLFSFKFDPALERGRGKKVTGLLNIPSGDGSFPLIVLFRGYVDQEIYKTGDGSRRVGEYFAANGFITVAPDFLGYGGSDEEAANIFESRFQTYTTALTLIKSLDSIDKWDKKNMSIWGHSNGGQIALTVLEITQSAFPTVLWAPVSKPFPYSILYYTDESEDRGKLIRKELAKFEEQYNPDLYSIDLYYQRIKAPIELHQGANDDAVPLSWSNALSTTLKNSNIDPNYFTYNGADHNLNPSWNLAVERSLEFFRKNLTKPD